MPIPETSPVLLVVDTSDLAEALAQALPDLVFHTQKPEAASDKNMLPPSLVVIDSSMTYTETTQWPSTALLSFKRPVRLANLARDIASRLRKPMRTTVVLRAGWEWLPEERMLHAPEADARTVLTEKEAELFAFLLSFQEEAPSRDTLLRNVWGYNDAVTSHTLETHIYRLRGKLRQASELFDIISLEEGGYRLQGVTLL